MEKILGQKEYCTLFNDFECISKIDGERQDKLAVDHGKLVLSEGGFLQSPTRLVKNLFYGGYNRDAVVDYLEKLAARTEAFCLELKKTANYLSQEGTLQFARKVVRVGKGLQELEDEYRNLESFPAGADKTADRLFALYKKFIFIGEDLKEQIKQIDPSLFQKVKKPPIDFDAPVRLKKIKSYLPSHQTPQDTLRLVQSAQKQIIPLWKKRVVVSFGVVGSSVATFLVFALSVFKWAFWNPLEWAVKGKIVTRSPLLWLLEEWFRWQDSYFKNDSEIAIRKYADQLLGTPHITDEHVDAYCQLASYVEDVFLATAFLEGSEGAVKANRACPVISIAGLCKIIRAVGGYPKCKSVSLPMGAAQNKEVINTLKKQGFKKDIGDSFYKRER